MSWSPSAACVAANSWPADAQKTDKRGVRHTNALATARDGDEYEPAAICFLCAGQQHTGQLLCFHGASVVKLQLRDSGACMHSLILVDMLAIVKHGKVLREAINAAGVVPAGAVLYLWGLAAE